MSKRKEMLVMQLKAIGALALLVLMVLSFPLYHKIPAILVLLLL